MPTGTAGRMAWRVWVPPLLVVMIELAMITYTDGAHLRDVPTGELILILHGAVALLWRLRFPVVVAIFTVLCGAALPMLPEHYVITDVASMVALYTVALSRPRRITIALAVFATVLLTASVVIWLPEHFLNLSSLLPLNCVVLSVAVGDAIRNRRALLAQLRDRAEQAERDREAEARRQVHDERIRIARDLHDVVAHHIALVNAQTGVALHLMEASPDRARQALAGIKETSRTALDELRATVGLLRQEGDPDQELQPTPGFAEAELDRLLETVRATGLEVELTRTGDPFPLSGPADLAAYRIVQEALTNARKHSTTPRVSLEIAYGETNLHLTVTNAAAASHRGAGTGHGLIGMRERARAAGGNLTAGLEDGDVFTVNARLPRLR
ncbi:sensor histidine kinase [Paractinoplanes atraurantiacus]|uniref:sensor histidine kinase n=1 Tax=Paractinoplanes atraurantiacus TaxID=1036182 RepID=UPI0011786D96|nr:histidine kinase [Actinoplanes atraurantiacus]